MRTAAGSAPAPGFTPTPCGVLRDIIAAPELHGLEPACGNAGFLLDALRRVREAR